MSLKKLPQVHSGQNRKGANDNISGGAVFKVWHVCSWHNFRDYSFVSMTTCDFITNDNFSHLGNFNNNFLKSAVFKLVTFIPSKDFYIDYCPFFAMRHSQ